MKTFAWNVRNGEKRKEGCNLKNDAEERIDLKWIQELKLAEVSQHVIREIWGSNG